MKSRFGLGALALVTLMFAASGALRFGSRIGISIANAAADPEQPVKAETCPAPPAALAAALSERESRVSARETAVEDRIAALQLAEEALNGRLEALQEAEASLRRTVAIADQAAEEDLTRLTAVYESMKPKSVAALFNVMDAELAAGFIGRMQTDAAAGILAGMSADKAYAVSAILAGRNANAPTN